ncbi:hypothetical protein BKA69DRAFT_1175316 [Paraphysoderma sedebokerense]|nr:hypothetical protein BKA69DRAFT_1175316 [Paraphysoderma sedebokerense]
MESSLVVWSSMFSFSSLIVNCGDINISGGSGSLRPSTIQIPSAQWATSDSPGMKFDIFKTDNSTYVVPGPPVLASSETYKSSPTNAGRQNHGMPSFSEGRIPTYDGRTEDSAKPINSSPDYAETFPGENFPLCKGNHVTVVGSDGRRWGWEDSKSCIMPKNREIIGLSTPRCRARIGSAK